MAALTKPKILENTRLAQRGLNQTLSRRVTLPGPVRPGFSNGGAPVYLPLTKTWPFVVIVAIRLFCQVGESKPVSIGGFEIIVVHQSLAVSVAASPGY